MKIKLYVSQETIDRYKKGKSIDDIALYSPEEAKNYSTVSDFTFYKAELIIDVKGSGGKKK